ncbi:MAG: arylsulfatase [Saprospiraceae bacterium]|nr:arylsulfatase [Saprospiraceae bacterium]
MRTWFIIPWVLLGVLLHWSCGDVRQERPNILILYADDLGYGDVSAQNALSKIQTPYIDKLIGDGLQFTDGHSSSGICTPSRYALLTGRYHWRDFHGIVGPMGAPAFQEGQFTLAHLLQREGYYTGCVGKWHLGWDWEAIRKPNWTAMDSMQLWNRWMTFYPPEAYDWEKSVPGGPLERGFEYYYGDGTINFPPYAWVENDRVLEVPTETMTTPKGMALEGSWEARPGPALKDWDFFDVLPTITQKAVDFIEGQAQASRPFFLYVPFSSPHAPIIPNKEFQGTSEAGPYGDFVQQTDWSIGQILSALESIGEAENTLVIFTADNGPERYAYDRVQTFDHHSSSPFRGLKRDIYEGGHHVPFVVRWPSRIPAGTVSGQLISQVDILQTIASLLEIELPKGLQHDSHDMAEIWLEPEHEMDGSREAIVHNTFEGRYALRSGDWVYINHSTGYHSKPPEWAETHFGYPQDSSAVQLFNLDTDLSQHHNLADSLPERVEEMARVLADMRQKETFLE